MDVREFSKALGEIDEGYCAQALAYQPRRHRRPLWAAAACVCLVAALTLALVLPGRGGDFVLQAYALTQDEAGQVTLRELLLDQEDVWGGYYDGENLYINVALGCRGEDLKEVTFSVEQGFLARQACRSCSRRKTCPSSLWARSSGWPCGAMTLKFWGNQATVPAEELEDTLLFWGTATEDPHAHPQAVTVTAQATFVSGRQQTEQLTVDLSGMGAVSGQLLSPEDLEEARAESAYYETLPLEDCILVEDSVTDVEDEYEYSVEGTAIGIRCGRRTWTRTASSAAACLGSGPRGAQRLSAGDLPASGRHLTGHGLPGAPGAGIPRDLRGEKKERTACAVRSFCHFIPPSSPAPSDRRGAHPGTAPPGGCRRQGRSPGSAPRSPPGPGPQ